MVTKKELDYYKKILKILGSLTNLFSESKIPYLNYRVTENLYCKSFNANNLSRSDVSADASLENVGIGIKTFVNKNGKSLQKVAEFNKDNIQFRGLSDKELISKIADLRNKRIETTKRIYGLRNMIYHCIVRDEGKISIFECEMNLIDKNSIRIISSTKNTVTFKDSLNEYSFNITKSTLYKRFVTKNIIFEIEVKILKDPFEVLEKKFSNVKDFYYKKTIKENPFVILPLYSITKKEKIVYEKSGLNQWNAEGRKRNFNEIYIPIPAWIHKKFPVFFLSRDTPFRLILPDGTMLEAKICQDGSKALMSKHNADLGNWLLRKVLNLKEKELLTYKKLQMIGLDSVIIQRLDTKTYSIDFRPSGTYEKFIEDNNN
jgi:hypothetical protein